MTKHVRINITTKANTKLAKKTKRNGRDILIVPSATLPDDVVMNNVKYPADEIEKGYKTLNRTPAPFGHPIVGNTYISARDPEGLNLGYIGAWNENVRRENGRVFLDKVIDVAVASRSDEGKAVLNAVDKGEPIHTSTGLLCVLEEESGEGYDYIAREMEFDHDAILLNEEGAATPEQGVGMFVNSKGEKQEIDVINSVLEYAERDLEWAAEMAAQAVERIERASIVDRVVSAIKEAFTSSRENSATDGEAEMADNKQLDELSAKVNALSETVEGITKGIGDAIASAIKPLTDNLDEIKANQKASDDAKKAELVGKVVKANLLTEDVAKDTPVATLEALAANVKPGKAAGINGSSATTNSNDDEWAGYDLNAVGKTKEA